MKAVVVIPTYWGRPTGSPLNPADVVYDHPTPIDQEGTLARALESFAVLERRDFEVVVVAGATNKALEADVERKVLQIVSDFTRDLKVTVVSHTQAGEMRAALERQGDEDLTGLVNLYGYSNIRNFCLVAGQAAGADVIVLFDDDEVVEDPAYLDKALEFIGSECDGAPVKGKAGWYKRPDGGFLCPPTRDWWWMEWKGAEAMNHAFQVYIGRGKRLKPTPFAFGGNMVIHRDVFTRIPFDPRITRGEDIDYVVNAWMFGDRFYLDRELWIRHLPPQCVVPDWLGFRQNVLRFTYMRHKLQAQVETPGMTIVPTGELDPYPGRFLHEDLDAKIFNTSAMLGLHYMLERDEAGFEEATRNVRLAEEKMRDQSDPFAGYLELVGLWRRLTRLLDKSAELKAAITES